MNYLKVLWHCHRNKGHVKTSAPTALGISQYYCATCGYPIASPEAWGATIKGDK